MKAKSEEEIKLVLLLYGKQLEIMKIIFVRFLIRVNYCWH